MENREKVGIIFKSNLRNWVSQGITNTKIVNDPGRERIICWIFILKPWLQPVLSCNFCLVCPAPLLHLTIALCYTLFCLLRTLLTIAHTSPVKASLPQAVSKVRAMHARAPLTVCSLADNVTQQHIDIWKLKLCISFIRIRIFTDDFRLTLGSHCQFFRP